MQVKEPYGHYDMVTCRLSTSYMLQSHLTTIARGLLHKKERETCICFKSATRSVQSTLPIMPASASDSIEKEKFGKSQTLSLHYSSLGD